jgi:hypothetical protein
MMRIHRSPAKNINERNKMQFEIHAIKSLSQPIGEQQFSLILRG